jgi:hypothetical protein
MFPFLKGAVGGALFSAAVSWAIAGTGADASWLAVHGHLLDGHRFYWSWTLFIGGTGIGAWAALMAE